MLLRRPLMRYMLIPIGMLYIKNYLMNRFQWPTTGRAVKKMASLMIGVVVLEELVKGKIIRRSDCG